MKPFRARTSHLARLVSFSCVLVLVLSTGAPVPSSDAARKVDQPEGFGGGFEGRPDDPGPGKPQVLLTVQPLRPVRVSVTSAFWEYFWALVHVRF